MANNPPYHGPVDHLPLPVETQHEEGVCGVRDAAASGRAMPVLRRRHLFEFQDQSWFPQLFRRFITDQLAFHMSRAYAPAVPLLAESLRRTRRRAIRDLCSGSGGPLPALHGALEAQTGYALGVTLTDRYPSDTARARGRGGGAIRFRRSPVSALDPPDSSGDYRTMFSSLHHFRPEQVRRMLRRTADARVPLAALEVQERRLVNLLGLPPLMLFASLALTPFLPNRTWGRLFFTYVVPLAPLTLAWDTFVSCWRTYTPAELETLAASMQRAGYRWRTGRIRARGYIGPYRITWLIGEPAGA